MRHVAAHNPADFGGVIMSRTRRIISVDPANADFARSLIVYEDAHLIAFNKPSGLAVQTRGNRGPCLENLLPVFAKSNGKVPRLVHRLDAGTSGLLIAARTKPAAAHLSEQFAKRSIKKTYLALARGALPKENAGTIDQSLMKCVGERGRPPMIPSTAEGAQTAHTYWRILARSGGQTSDEPSAREVAPHRASGGQTQNALFELHPKTGRMHQLRVHLQHVGCPILGDPLYGTGKLSAPRLMLHAMRLRLRLPDGGDLDLEAPMPDEMTAFAVELGLVKPTEAA